MTFTDFCVWFIPFLIFVVFIIKREIKKTQEMIDKHGIKNYTYVQWKGKNYPKGREVGDKVQLLDFTPTRGVRSFFVDKSELGK